VREGFVVWVTGRPGCGKTTVANRVMTALRERGVGVLALDSDDLRPVLTPEPTYTDEERERFYRAIAHLARIAADGGVAVVISATGMKRAWRDTLRESTARFCEVELRCSLETAEVRDPKGLYAKARAGDIRGLPGFDAPLESADDAELRLDAERDDPAHLTDAVLRWLEAQSWLDGARARR
jgi:adenylylsulfate kinase